MFWCEFYYIRTCISDFIRNSKFKGPKIKSFWIMMNLYNSKSFKKLANSLLRKLVLLLSVQYAVACHAITVTNYCFTWCSVVINVIRNICFGSIICYIGKFYYEDIFLIFILYCVGELYENYHHRKDFSFKL
jgi:hypothetical protein